MELQLLYLHAILLHTAMNIVCVIMSSNLKTKNYLIMKFKVQRLLQDPVCKHCIIIIVYYNESDNNIVIGTFVLI